MMEEIIKKVSEELNIPEEVVTEAYNSYYDFVREKITELPLKDNLTEEEFNALKCNFNIPSLGKLYLTFDRYKRVKERFKYKQKIKEEYEHKEN